MQKIRIQDAVGSRLIISLSDGDFFASFGVMVAN